MPHTLARRSERRAFSRDGARQFAQPTPTAGPNRKDRRKQGWRGDVSALVHGPHDRAFLYSGTVNGGGQARINAKRTARAEFWRTVRVRVSAEVEQYFRDSLHLLGVGARIDGRTPLLNWWAVDLDVHIPGAPAGAVAAEPVYRSERTEDGYRAVLDHIEWTYSLGGKAHDPVSA